MTVPEKSPRKTDPSGVREVLRYLHVGSELAILTAAGAYGGVKLDQYWSLAPWGLVGGTLAGFAFGFYELFRITKNADIR